MNHPAKNALLLFFLGLLTALIFLQYPETLSFFEAVQQDGYAGVLFSGVLYAFSFTATSASIIFTNMTESINPFLGALVGGVGAVAYDVGIFFLSRRNGRERMQRFLQSHNPLHRHFPPWVTLLFGGIILASPLPDELAAGFFGVSNLSTAQFLLLSYLFNCIGIFVLLTL